MILYKIVTVFFMLVFMSCTPNNTDQSNYNFGSQIIENLKNKKSFEIKASSNIKVFLLRPYEIGEYKEIVVNDLGSETYKKIMNKIMHSEKFLLLAIEENKYWEFDLNGIVAFNRNF